MNELKNKIENIESMKKEIIGINSNENDAILLTNQLDSLKRELSNYESQYEQKKIEYSNALRKTNTGKLFNLLITLKLIDIDLELSIHNSLAEKTENITDSFILYLINKLNTKYPRIFNVILEFNIIIIQNNIEQLNKFWCDAIAEKLGFTTRFKDKLHSLKDFVIELYNINIFDTLNPFKILLMLIINININYPNLFIILINFNNINTHESLELYINMNLVPSKISTTSTILEIALNTLKSQFTPFLSEILYSLSRLNNQNPNFFNNIRMFNYYQNDKGFMDRDKFKIFLVYSIQPSFESSGIRIPPEYIMKYLIDIKKRIRATKEKNVEIDFKQFIQILKKYLNGIKL